LFPVRTDVQEVLQARVGHLNAIWLAAMQLSEIQYFASIANDC